MKFTEDSGIKITEEIKGLINQAIKTEGSRRALGDLLGISHVNIGNWTGRLKEQGLGFIITWDMWTKLKQYFIKHCMIDSDDPRWMTPTELRAELKRPKSPTKQWKLDELEECLLNHFRNIPDANKPLAIQLVKTLEIHIMTPIEEPPSKNSSSIGNSAG